MSTVHPTHVSPCDSNGSVLPTGIASLTLPRVRGAAMRLLLAAGLVGLTAASFGVQSLVFAQPNPQTNSRVPEQFRDNFNQSQLQRIQDSTPSDPGFVTPDIEDVGDEDKPKKNEYIPDPQAEPDEVEIDVPEQAPRVRMQSPEFYSNSIEVQGATLLDEDDLDQVVSKYEQRNVTLEELGKLVDEINKMYRAKGYLTTQAYIPPQDVEGGNLVIAVQEGRIGALDIAGNKYHNTWAIRRFLTQQPGEPLNIPKLEKNLLRMNRNQGYIAKATLAAGENPGETDIRLDIEEAQPWQISGTFDNQGRPFIGTYRWGAELNNDSLLGFGDRLSGKWLQSAGTLVALGSYSVPLTRWGTELSTNFVYSNVNVDLEFQNQPEITGSAYNYGIQLSQPLDPDRTFVADVGFNARRISSFFRPFPYGQNQRILTNQDNIRSITAGLNFNKPDRWGRTFLRAQSTWGPHWLGADTRSYTGNRPSRFWKMEAIGNRVFTLPHNNLLIVRGYAQFTPDALPSAEQFQVGGAFSVRGYTEGLLSGDRGYNIGVEHRYPIPFLRYLSPWLADRVQGATFFDIGQVWLDESNANYAPGFSNRNKQTLLVGGGFGLRARLTRFLQGFIDFGVGFADRGNVEPNAQPTIRIHFGIRSDLLAKNFKQQSDRVTRYRLDEDGRLTKTQLNAIAAENDDATPVDESPPQQQKTPDLDNSTKNIDSSTNPSEPQPAEPDETPGLKLDSFSQEVRLQLDREPS